MTLIDMQLANAGWTVWISRSRRYYCPEHTPDATRTLMRKVFP